MPNSSTHEFTLDVNAAFFKVTKSHLVYIHISTQHNTIRHADSKSKPAHAMAML